MFLKVDHIYKSFGREPVLRDLSFTLEAQGMLSILGRSGSGKTTLLKILAGLETADAGTMELMGKRFDEVPAHRRNIVYLYQEPLLFPHLNVLDNLAFGLRLRRQAEKAIQEQVDRLLENLELSGQARKMPHQLSGGQRQRVAFGRALIIQPKMLLLDEPFGALDSETRSNMQQLLKRMVAQSKITTLFVTHDLKEALLMGDAFASMQGGSLRLYPGKKAFMEDGATGVQSEIDFWEGLRQEK